MLYLTHGKTLIELISALAVITIVIGLAAPSLSRFLSRTEATNQINWIVGAVNYTRHAAISFRTMTTLCPLDSAHAKPRCGKKWSNDLMVFLDRNADGKLNGKDKLVQRIPKTNYEGSLTWRAFRNRQYLQITPFGYTNFQNGNFTYCAANADPTLSRQIVVNVQGRARVVHYKNNLGHRLDRKGKPLRC